MTLAESEIKVKSVKLRNAIQDLIDNFIQENGVKIRHLSLDYNKVYLETVQDESKYLYAINTNL